mmetsp:Transcript_52230/g.151775  ORF Transcript_52230/g.151775 Transcript_52230/m.151775 type:complete len:318 (+) Transcript_52230:933-1886(+)
MCGLRLLQQAVLRQRLQQLPQRPREHVRPSFIIPVVHLQALAGVRIHYACKCPELVGQVGLPQVSAGKEHFYSCAEEALRHCSILRQQLPSHPASGKQGIQHDLTGVYSVGLRRGADLNRLLGFRERCCQLLNQFALNVLASGGARDCIFERDMTSLCVARLHDAGQVLQGRVHNCEKLKPLRVWLRFPREKAMLRPRALPPPTRKPSTGRPSTRKRCTAILAAAEQRHRGCRRAQQLRTVDDGRALVVQEQLILHRILLRGLDHPHHNCCLGRLTRRAALDTDAVAYAPLAGAGSVAQLLELRLTHAARPQPLPCP